MRPLVAITAGDPGGIGPEVVVKALRLSSVRRHCRAVVIGDPQALDAAGWNPSLSGLMPVSCGRLSRGRVTAAQGEASFRAAKLGAVLALKGAVSAVVTAPVSKEAWALARAGYVGHTELLQDLSGARHVAMMFAAGPLRAALVTGHIPLRKVPGAVKAPGVIAAARLVHGELKRRLGIRRPRVAVCALNPHAGEQGLLGMEEKRVLGPAVRALKPLGVEGPLAADAAWGAMRLGRYDALVALYHDQALAPLKAVSPHGVVHWTLGLPFVRTSPAHGTAFDIAGRGLADPTAMAAAILLACELASRKG